MVITLSVIALILVVSFYDYFSARNWQQVTSATRNDIVFETRNKEYGAYAIRRDYDKKMLIIFFSLCFVVGAAYGTLKIFQNLPEDKEEDVALHQTQVKVKIPPKVEVVIPPPEPPPPPPMEKLVAFLPPVVVDEVVDTPPVNQDDLDKGKISDINQEGDDGDQKFDLTEKQPEPEVEKVEEIVTYVDEEATLPNYAQFVGSNLQYPQIAVEEGLEGKCYIEFTVEKNGEINSIVVKKGVPDCKECDAEAMRVIRMMPKWVPGKVNGKPVRSKHVAVISFKLQG